MESIVRLFPFLLCLLMKIGYDDASTPPKMALYALLGVSENSGS